MSTFDLNTKQGCIRFVADRRYAARVTGETLEFFHEQNHSDRRAARKLRESNNPILARRADVIESQIEGRSRGIRRACEVLDEIGDDIFVNADRIDLQIPQPALLDLLNVNIADRKEVGIGDGIVKIAFILGLEDSAENRDKDFKCGPIFRALQNRLMRELLHNEELKRSANEMLFGPGGMFEFVPKYQQMPDGSMKRLPPPLRIVGDDGAAA